MWFFGFSEYEFNEEGRQKVHEIATVLNSFRARDRDVDIAGHTDSIGQDDTNLVLSQNRADYVKDELIFSQLDQKRVLSSVGYGSSKPLAPNKADDGSDNPDGRAKNRRVEVLVRNPQ